ncbi:MAG: site-2 protease family protein [Chloroflexota bacterium]
MPGSLRVARILGIDIRVHFSWILIFLLITFSLASEVLPTGWSEVKQLAVAAFAALLFFASLLAHELAHALVARASGMTVSSITLFLLGGVANLTTEPRSALAELAMAVSGPLTSFALAGVAYLVQQTAAGLLDPVIADTITPVAGYLTFVNLAVGVFNLVPGFPLDGGRVLRSIIWAIRGDRAKATAIAARGGQIVAVAIGLLGLLVLLVLGDGFGLWYLLIAWFLFGMASASIAQERIQAAAAGVRVSQLMTSEPRTARPEMSAAELVRDVMLPFNIAVVPVVSGGRLLGTVGLDELAGIDESARPLIGVAQVMIPAERVATVTPQDDLIVAIERLGDGALLPVLRDGVLVGALYRDTVSSYLRMRTALGRASATAPHGA